MATREQLIASIDPGYWEWLQTKPNALEKVRALIREALQLDPNRQINWLTKQIGELKSFKTFTSGDVEDEVAPDEEPAEETPPEEPFQPGPVPDVDDAASRAELLAALQQFLFDNQLPGSLVDFIREAIAQKKSYSQIILELRQTPEYKAAYPENDIRLANGLSWMSEAAIRDYRDEAKRLAYEYMGVNVTNEQIANLIGRGTSLRLWEHRLEVNDLVQRFGLGVQQVWESYTGAPMSEEQLHAFMDPDFATPDIDRKYALALMRGQPEELGFGVRPEEEAELLERFGIDPNRVFENYREIAGSLGRFERLAAIGGYLETGGTDFFSDISVSGSLLFRAVQLGDPKALAELRRRSSEETARFGRVGGPVVGREGELAGLQAR